jgi:hypothetical protein
VSTYVADVLFHFVSSHTADVFFLCVSSYVADVSFHSVKSRIVVSFLETTHRFISCSIPRAAATVCVALRVFDEEWGVICKTCHERLVFQTLGNCITPE